MHAILLAAQVCFASLAVVGRETITHIPPGVVPLVRTVGGALAFFALARWRGVWRWNWRDTPFLALCALLGVVLNQELFIHGLKYSGAINGTVLGSTIPVFTVIAAVALRKEQFAAMRGLGIVLAFAGCAYLVGIENLSLGGPQLFGSLLVLGNAASYGLYLVLVRRYKDAYDPVGLIAVLFVLAVPMVVPTALYEWHAMPALVAADYVRLAYLVAVPTVAAYALVQIALQRAEATLVASYIYLQPVLASIGAMARLGEQLSPRVLIAAPLVFGGVFLAGRARTRA